MSKASIRCTGCAYEHFTKAGRDRHGRQLQRCAGCGCRTTARSSSAFGGYRFPDELIAFAVRWYLRFRLSYAEVAEWLAERDVTVDPSTIDDWVQAFTSRFIEAARQHRSPVCTRWHVDETLLKIGRRWRYVFRCLDEHGQIVEVCLSDQRDAASARACCDRAVAASDAVPTRVISDQAKRYPPAVRALVPGAEHRCSKYLNNGLERDQQCLKGRVRPLRRFKPPATANPFCRGHALSRNLGRGLTQLAAGLRHACGSLPLGLHSPWGSEPSRCPECGGY